MVVRINGMGTEGVWCMSCIGEAFPFTGIVSETEFKAALREYRQGLGSAAGNFQEIRLGREEPYFGIS